MKKLITLALASLTTLTLAGCGATDTVALDTSKMTDGTSNKTGLGGYWWTYVDRSGQSIVTPNTGKVKPEDPMSTELGPSITDGAQKGLEDDGAGNKAIRVTGSVAVAPKWSATLGTTTCEVGGVNWCDPYVEGYHASLCAGGKCGEVKYPAAGLGFGFKAGNSALGANATGKVGIAFKMKLGAGHGQTASPGTNNPIAISLPLDLTDVPDPSFGDKYGTQYAPGFGAAPGTLASGAQVPTATNEPFCSFPQSLQADGTSVVGGTNKICFANLATLVNPPPTAAWTSYCVRWEAFQAPAWATGLGLLGLGVLKDATADFTSRIIKMQFDAYKPKDSETVPAPFDFYVDDVYLLDDANFAEHCTGATEIVNSPDNQAP